MQASVYSEMAAVQDRHWWFAARRKILAAVIDSLKLPPQSEILEIGCGTGGNLAMLASFGRLSAMEYDDGARKIAEELAVCPVEGGKLPDPVHFENGTFDLICLLDVLEHIEDDRTALARVAQLLKPNGRILVTVPAYQWLWSQHDVAHHHHRRYTNKMLHGLADASKLSVIHSGYFNTLLFPLIATARILGKLTGKKGGSDAALPKAPLNTLLKTVFGLERHVVPHLQLPFGTSILSVLSIRQ